MEWALDITFYMLKLVFEKVQKYKVIFTLVLRSFC